MQDREFAVVLEGLRSDFKVFNEGLTDVREQVKELHQETKEIRQDMKKLDKKIDTVHAELGKKIDVVHIQLMDFSDDAKQILNNHEERIAKLETCKQ